ncbi:Ldh family oxidoreductase [Candidimonas humi]|uniref:Ldh family oxidoreductase n=1 Tax=Candidimonas humi TaxID=683355 RepID=A0ABV8NTP3_9BURK|nr:Ldh family oxidoreductase [Candidimonas humi]MBV6303348.1 Ldh family oxidoreductase [Candidimonas humi]
MTCGTEQDLRIPATALSAYAAELLRRAGMTAQQAAAVAGRLVESDLLGHRTHGVAMLPTYLERLADGRIRTAGSIDVLNDDGANFTWQANRLPGAWVVDRAVSQAIERSRNHAVVTASIAECTHIGALQAYFDEIAECKLMALMMVTDPGVASVAPFGGADPVLTSNPLGACIPTHGQPILIDQSTSVTSNASVRQYELAGKKLPGKWLLDCEGVATDDPGALAGEPPGTIMPIGGEDFGYKGFAFGLLVETFALALCGFGRSQPRVRGGQGVFLQLLDPDRFCGRQRFLDETTALARQCKASRPARGSDGVRLPGERALMLKHEQQISGVALSAARVRQVDDWAERLSAPHLASLACTRT